MIARRSVWADPEVVELTARFVPAADEVGRLQRGKEPDCVLFQQMAEHGHYGGRTQPTNTRQGIYALAPSGAFLASINHNDPRRVAGMLRQALARWEELPEDERLGAEPTAKDVVRWEAAYPADGLVLQVLCRDLPRPDHPADERDWRTHAWNVDWAWFRADEACTFVPAELEPGAVHDVPAPLVARLARCHLVDAVRGQVPEFPEDAVLEGWLRARVTHADARHVDLQLDGRTHTETRGRWPVRGFADRDAPGEQTRGFDARLLGSARWDREARRFVAFELFALGERWGGTQYNGRGDDLQRAPMGVLLRLSHDGPRVAPALIWAYGWRPPRPRK